MSYFGLIFHYSGAVFAPVCGIRIGLEEKFSIFNFLFIGGLECVGYSFSYVDHTVYVFLGMSGIESRVLP
jgi:hypothetical protein